MKHYKINKANRLSWSLYEESKEVSPDDPQGSTAENISFSDASLEKRDKTDRPESNEKYSKRIFTEISNQNTFDPGG